MKTQNTILIGLLTLLSITIGISQNCYEKFIDDFATIGKTSGKHLDLLACSVGSAVRGNNAGIRSGGCKYPLMQAWKMISKHPQLGADISTLHSVANLRTKGIPDADVLKIIDNLATAGVKCKECTSGTLDYRLFHEVLDDIAYAKTNFGNTTGFTKLYNEILNNSVTYTKGAIWVLDVARNKGIGNVTEFGGKIGNTNFASDIIANGKHIECKNWADMPPSYEPQFVSQLAAKLNAFENIDEMAYYWARYKPDPDKLKLVLKNDKDKLAQHMSADKRFDWFKTQNEIIPDAEINKFVDDFYTQFMF